MRFLLVMACIAVFDLGGGAVFAADRLKLESSVVIGNRELPKSLYIVPWKSVKKEGLIDWALLKGHEEAVNPIDRYVFKRKLQYRAQLNEGSHTVADSQ